MYKCPKGHDSTDSDFCSDCGAKISGQSFIKKEESEKQIDENCPDCGTTRMSGGFFCEVCQYDFRNKKSSLQKSSSIVNVIPEKVEKIIVEQQPAMAPIAKETSTITTQSIKNYIRIKAVVKIDLSLITEPVEGVKLPENHDDRTFPIDLDENLIGRRSDTKKIYPEVEVSDSGVSHRHCQIIKQSDGSFSLIDLNSANGTKLNGKDLIPGVINKLNVGDEIILGMWSKILIQER